MAVLCEPLRAARELAGLRSSARVAGSQVRSSQQQQQQQQQRNFPADDLEDPRYQLDSRNSVRSNTNANNAIAAQNGNAAAYIPPQNISCNNNANSVTPSQQNITPSEALLAAITPDAAVADAAADDETANNTNNNQNICQQPPTSTTPSQQQQQQQQQSRQQQRQATSQQTARQQQYGTVRCSHPSPHFSTPQQATPVYGTLGRNNQQRPRSAASSLNQIFAPSNNAQQNQDRQTGHLLSSQRFRDATQGDDALSVSSISTTDSYCQKLHTFKFGTTPYGPDAFAVQPMMPTAGRPNGSLNALSTKAIYQRVNTRKHVHTDVYGPSNFLAHPFDETPGQFVRSGIAVKVTQTLNPQEELKTQNRALWSSTCPGVRKSLDGTLRQRNEVDELSCSASNIKFGNTRFGPDAPFIDRTMRPAGRPNGSCNPLSTLASSTAPNMQRLSHIDSLRHNFLVHPIQETPQQKVKRISVARISEPNKVGTIPFEFCQQAFTARH